MIDEKIIGMASQAISKKKGILTSLGIGSCVVCVIYDSEKHIAGMFHIMLPNSKEINSSIINKCKFADTCVSFVIENLRKEGANLNNLHAKLTGGAHMFKSIKNSSLFNIGEKNVIAVKNELNKFNIKLEAEDVGGSVGRTVKFDVEKLTFSIKTKNEIKNI